MTHEPRIFVTVERTFNLGNFEREKINIGLSGLPFEADDAYIQSGLDTADRALVAIRGRMRSSIADIRQEPPVIVERKANHRALDETPEPLEPINETGIDITSSVGLGCVVCGSIDLLTDCDLGMVCPSCLADIADDEAEAVDEATEGGKDSGDADQDGQPEPVQVAPAIATKTDPPSVEPDARKLGEPGPIKEGRQLGEPGPHKEGRQLGHPEGCHCNDCGWDPFKDGADDIPCPQGCQCATCMDKGKRCVTCSKEKPALAIWWRQTDGTLLCNECKGVPSAEKELPAAKGHSYLAKGETCQVCGLSIGKTTTHCPGKVVTAEQGQAVVAGRLDFKGLHWGKPSTPNDFPAANSPSPTESGAPVEQLAGSVDTTDRTSPPKTDKPSATSGPEDIPGEDDITTKLSIFGVDVDIPPMEWAKVPITETSEDGGGGQMKALNTVLSLIGYKGKDRHWASLAILHSGFGPFRGTLDSLKDLTKAEAHVILSYLDAATPESKVLLFDAACAMKGQIPLRLSPETETGVAA